MSPPAVELDYNHLANEFDRFLPQIRPVGEALLERLPRLADGATVLDVACGTGEPGLTLARTSPKLRVRGVDQAESLITVARHKAQRAQLGNIDFALMGMQALVLPAASVDAAISRFGLLMFGDVPASARELARVLKRGAPYSLAVWDDPAENTLMNTLVGILRRHLPPGFSQPFDALAEWSAEGRRVALLEALSLGPVHSEMFRWEYRFGSFDEPWALVRTMDRFTGQASLTPQTQEAVRGELETSLARCRQPDGHWVIPHACRLIWGTSSAAS